MHINVIREALHKQPFQPFTIRLVDGRQLAVPHPDFVAVSRRLAIVINAADDSITWVEPMLILSIDYPNGVAKPAAGTETGDNP